MKNGLSVKPALLTLPASGLALSAAAAVGCSPAPESDAVGSEAMAASPVGDWILRRMRSVDAPTGPQPYAYGYSYGYSYGYGYAGCARDDFGSLRIDVDGAARFRIAEPEVCTAPSLRDAAWEEVAPASFRIAADGWVDLSCTLLGAALDCVDEAGDDWVFEAASRR